MKSSSYLLEGGATLPLAPLIDVVFLLLIFFMLITRYLPPTLAVTLPEASTAAVSERPGISVSIDLDGTLSLDGSLIPWDALPGLLSGRDPEAQVRISADRGTDYGYVVRALDAAAGAGLRHVALETVPPD
ncbi:biopolymer transporter ExbD [bacterium]|nr:biopolymer transporter ExbD [bacterium]